MCVFLSMRADKSNLQKRFNAEFLEEELFGRKYVQSAFEFPLWPVIPASRPTEIRLMSWGLVPSWIRDSHSASEIRKKTVNSRAETLYEKPSFRKAAVSGHCLVLADGFFEFRELNGKKYPYFIRLRDGRLFAMAGLSESWLDPETGELIPTFSIVTTVANPLMAVIHNTKKRMPVILPAEKEKDWLQSGREGAPLLVPYPESEMEAWPVSRLITSRDAPKNRPEVQEPFEYEELSNPGPIQESLF